ncbi:pre-mycofactocin synthase MftD [Nocardia veterana]|uniref:Mycofactocin biosynthesis FMN-dependent deaminase MftD n=1 Tax=Nocardia veterana TaxID=132249 RepID=A0A7X6RKS7_9NOCA|nr:pre-mycofactocin synthase MftD [Nocardia veterana]NKY89601.1 mycofactocin biosynthesis FMN-dependent deaminase MftD [Nocardia veterana]
MASTKDWFETVAEARERAEKRVPKAVYLALLAGSEGGVSLADNTAAFAELGLRPHIADLPAQRVQSTTLMGQEISLPVICSPTGVQAVDPAGEVAVARAAAMSGTAIGLSSFASKPIEEVVAANDKLFFQMYWLGDRDAILARLDRAKRAGAKGLIITLDWVFATARDWGSPPLPERIDVKTAIRFAPQVLSRPGWLARFLRAGRLPDLTTPNLVGAGEKGPTFFGAYGEWMGTPPVTWEDLAWLREQWDGPFMIKGIGRPDDARRAVDIGASAISVSNHGGNNLDTTPAAIRLLPSVVDAVGADVEVVLDGGIRRGSDVVKALALGARAVMIGRPYLWGMAANGERGVHNVLEILRHGIDSTLYGLGRESIEDLTRDDVLVPDGFTRGMS